MRLQYPTIPLALNREAYVGVGDDVLVPRRLADATFTYLADDDDSVVLSVTVDAEMVDGRPTCTRMVITAGTEEITRSLLAQLDPLWFVARTLSTGGMVPEGSAGSTFSPDPTAAGEALARLPRRRSVDSARLAEVAAAYRRGGAVAVKRDCNVSRSQAFRLVKQARESGLLRTEGS
jgi:hypothetical protein